MFNLLVHHVTIKLLKVNIQKFYIMRTEYNSKFRNDLRANSKFHPHRISWHIVYNQGVCLLVVTHCFLKITDGISSLEG